MNNQLEVILFFSALLAVANALYDIYLWRTKEKVNHSLEAIIRFAFIVVLVYFYSEMFWNFFVGVVMGCAMFWIVFELGYNLLRRVTTPENPYYLFFVGTTAWSDKLIRKILPYPVGVWLFGIKLIVLGASIYLFLI